MATPVELLVLAETKFVRKGTVPCSDSLHVIRIIDNQLWVCQRQKIEILDKNLKWLKVLHNKAWGHVYDVTLVPNAGIVIACTNGLLNINSKGETMSVIDSGDFTSVDIYKGTLYASENETDTIYSYIYNDGTFVNQGSSLLHRSGSSTISVNNTITQCNSNSCMIDVSDMSGQQLYSYGRWGTKNAGNLQCPKICQEDGEGTLLIADSKNHRLQLLDKCRAKWSIINLEPQLSCPRKAAYVDVALYVESG